MFLSFAINAQDIDSVTDKTIIESPVEFVQNYLPMPATAKQAIISETSINGNKHSLKSIAKSNEKFGESVLNWIQDKYSTVLQVLPNQITNVMLYRFIDEWSGVKYRMGGTNKSGIDCSAFVQTLYQYVFGLNLLRTARMQFSETNFIKNISDLKEGDLVFFKINSSQISHVGVYLKNNFFVHSASSKGVSIASLSSDYWNKYYVGGGRIIN
ncbi:MAG: glycoside hydrolase [Bacteroidetes bacterium OLB11]|nr:MAG: glycoside hydrolase [Bacteroidetes bacterium OLB11]